MRIGPKKQKPDDHYIGGLLEKGIEKKKGEITRFFEDKKIQWQNIPTSTRIRNQVGFFFRGFKGFSKSFRDDYKNHLINEMVWELKQTDQRFKNADIQKLKLALSAAFENYNIIQIQNLRSSKLENNILNKLQYSPFLD